MDILSSLFDPQNFTGVTGLLNRLQPSMVALRPPADPSSPFEQASSLDTAQWPFGPVGAPSEANAKLPDNAQPTAGNAPLALAPAPTATSVPTADSTPDFIGGIRTKINDNSNLLLGLAAGLAGGKTWGEGLSKGAALAMQGAQLDTKQGAVNQTEQFLLKRGVDPAMARSIASNPAALKAILPQLMGIADKTTDIKNFEYGSKNPAFGKFLADSKNGGVPEYGLTPIYGQNEKGETVLGVTAKDGSFKQIELPPGFVPQSGVDKIDMGTQWMLRDRKSGQVVGYAPKDLKGAESEKALGKVQGAAKASLPGDLQTAQSTIAQIDQLLEHKGLDSIVGQLDQFKPNWMMSDDGADALTRFNQLKGKAFLQAYSMLRGGGQITEVEGTKAENAMARLDRAQSEGDFKQALRDFKDAVQTGMEKLREKAGVAGPQGKTSTGVSWSIQ